MAEEAPQRKRLQLKPRDESVARQLDMERANSAKKVGIGGQITPASLATGAACRPGEEAR